MDDLRDSVLQRLAGRRGPHDPDAARVWARLDAAGRERLRRVAVDPDAARHLHDRRDRFLVDVLAAEHARRRPTDLVGPVLLGLLVFSTIWGFGRAAFPASAGQYLVVGLVGLVVTTLVGLRRRAVVRATARQVRRELRAEDDPA